VPDEACTRKTKSGQTFRNPAVADCLCTPGNIPEKTAEI
jgi:hypothetical protein